MITDSYTPTPASTPTRLRERASYDRAAVHAVIDEAVYSHLGFVVDGRPVVLPQLHVRVEEVLYFHGSTGARALRTARAGGLPVCATITLVDGLVLARSAFHHSVNYRSVVVQGLAEVVTDPPEKEAALAALVEAVAPGRSAEVRGPSNKELAATTVLRLPIEIVSLKQRSGPPLDEGHDLDLPYWAGVLPLAPLRPGVPEPAPDLTPGISTPEHVLEWSR